MWPWFYLSIFVITLLAIATLTFLMDSIYIPKPKVKLLIPASYSFTFLYMAIRSYFTEDDINWNIFKSYNLKYTNINFKFVLISSAINISFFLMKPFFSILYAKCCLKQSNRQENDNSSIDGGRKGLISQRSHTLYRRPMITWTNIGVDNKDLHDNRSHSREKQIKDIILVTNSPRQ